MASKKDGEHKVEWDSEWGDFEIFQTFDRTDDAMQGLLGYHLYVAASVKSASFDDKFSRLPKGVIPLTHSWVRRYSQTDLIENMEELFDSTHARSSLIVLVAMFDAALLAFAARLNKEEPDDSIFRDIKDLERCGYKKPLKRALDFANLNKESLYGGPEDDDRKEMIKRVPDLCCVVDEARRLRNIFMHNHGLFWKKYGTDTIEVPDRRPIMRQQFLREFLLESKQKISGHLNHEEFTKYMKKFLKEPRQKVPVLLTPEEYISCSCSHIELLHDLHDMIQREYFGLTGSGIPSYKKRKKPIVWRRVLIGV